MKKIFTLVAIMFCMLVSHRGNSQTYPPHALVWGTSPFQDSMWAFDVANNFAIVYAIGPSLPGFTITGMNSLVFDPC